DGIRDFHVTGVQTCALPILRFSDRSGAGTAIKLMTDGILLAESQRDPLLRRYDTIIIDEAHERSLNIDFLLGFLKQLLPKRPDRSEERRVGRERGSRE